MTLSRFATYCQLLATIGTHPPNFRPIASLIKNDFYRLIWVADIEVRFFAGPTKTAFELQRHLRFSYPTMAPSSLNQHSLAKNSKLTKVRRWYRHSPRSPIYVPDSPISVVALRKHTENISILSHLETPRSTRPLHCRPGCRWSSLPDLCLSPRTWAGISWRAAVDLSDRSLAVQRAVRSGCWLRVDGGSDQARIHIPDFAKGGVTAKRPGDPG